MKTVAALKATFSESAQTLTLRTVATGCSNHWATTLIEEVAKQVGRPFPYNGDRSCIFKSVRTKTLENMSSSSLDVIADCFEELDGASNIGRWVKEGNYFDLTIEYVA